jgi:hypothetical protein
VRLAEEAITSEKAGAFSLVMGICGSTPAQASLVEKDTVFNATTTASSATESWSGSAADLWAAPLSQMESPGPIEEADAAAAKSESGGDDMKLLMDEYDICKGAHDRGAHVIPLGLLWDSDGSGTAIASATHGNAVRVERQRSSTLTTEVAVTRLQAALRGRAARARVRTPALVHTVTSTARGDASAPRPVSRSVKIKKRPPLTPSRYRTPRHDGHAPDFTFPKAVRRDPEGDTESTCTRSDTTAGENGSSGCELGATE